MTAIIIIISKNIDTLKYNVKWYSLLVINFNIYLCFEPSTRLPLSHKTWIQFLIPIPDFLYFGYLIHTHFYHYHP